MKAVIPFFMGLLCILLLLGCDQSESMTDLTTELEEINTVNEAKVNPDRLIELINIKRSKNLGRQNDLDRLAYRLNITCGFSHSCAETPEALFFSSTRTTALQVVNAWIRSSKYFAIISNTKYRYAGVHTRKVNDGYVVRAVFK